MISREILEDARSTDPASEVIRISVHQISPGADDRYEREHTKTLLACTNMHFAIFIQKIRQKHENGLREIEHTCKHRTHC